MIKVACAEESSLDFFLKNQPELTKDILTPEDWKWLQKFNNFLGKFEAYTLENEGYQGDIARSLTTLVIGFDIKVEKLELDRKQRKVYDPSSRRTLTNLFRMCLREISTPVTMLCLQHNRNGSTSFTAILFI